MPSRTFEPAATATDTRSLWPTTTPMEPAIEPDVVIDCGIVLAEAPIPFGTNGWWTDQDANVWRTRYRELAPQIVRLPLLHAFLEPINDDARPENVNWDGFRFGEPISWFDRTITYQRWFELLRDLNVTLMLHTPYLASWLSTTSTAGGLGTFPPTSVAEYEEFVEATLRFLVQEVEYPPQRILLEPINEPDLRCGQDTAVPCFWSNWSMDDLVNVLHAARQATEAVHSAIRVVGLSTCCDHALVDQLMTEYDGIELLDGLTYHSYIRGFDQSEAVQVGHQLAQWGLPVYLNEYGSPEYWSDGLEGALWHAAAVAQIWSNALCPVQFSMSEFPGMHTGYNQLGLSADWQRGFEPKPAYRVYVGFARHLGPTLPLSSKSGPNLIVTAGRSDNEQITIWVVNTSQEDQPETTFRIIGFADSEASVDTYDLARSDAVTSFSADGVPLAFVYDLPPRSGRVFILTPVGSAVESING